MNTAVYTGYNGHPMSGGGYTSSAKGGMYSSSFHSATYSHAANTHSEHSSEQNTYRIGQNRLITGCFKQPKMAEVVNLASMRVGETDAYSTTQTRPGNIRRVGGGDSQSEPIPQPLGNTPYFLFGLLLIGYAAFVKRRQIFKK